MVKLTSIAAGVAAIAATASATTTLAQSDERVNLVELELTWAQYYMFQAAHPTETYPVEVGVAVFNYGDFTTMLTGIAPDQVTRMITGVPWYPAD
ncbi:BBF_collapsed_G0028450.mRNA.1.CDS.1 [Saccharomyces cerevisiae]|nr:BBF_collapsed_G0028450.mRNA.1.CDS.1 [Saccharomyces cerevisiae]